MRPLLTFLALAGCCCAAVSGYDLTLTGSELPGGFAYYMEDGYVNLDSVLLLDDFDVDDLERADSIVFPDGKKADLSEGYYEGRFLEYDVVKNGGQYDGGYVKVDPDKRTASGLFYDVQGNNYFINRLPADLAQEAGVKVDGDDGDPRHVLIKNWTPYTY